MRRFTIVIALILAITGQAHAQNAKHHLVWTSGTLKEVTASGGFMAVCVDPMDGISILENNTSNIKWGVGSSQTPKAAAEMLPYFSIPALVSAGCLEELLTHYKELHGRDDTIVRSFYW